MTAAERLAHCAARASDRPLFFGHTLRRFATARCWTNAQLAAWLDCNAETLTHLRLCRTPGADMRFTAEEDVTAIAESLGVSAEKLREVMGQ